MSISVGGWGRESGGRWGRDFKRDGGGRGVAGRWGEISVEMAEVGELR